MWGGNPDTAMVIGVEHPPSRPKNLVEGEVKLYDDQGQFVFLLRAMLRIFTPKKLEMQSDGLMTIWSTNSNVIIKSPGGTVHINPP